MKRSIFFISGQTEHVSLSVSHLAQTSVPNLSQSSSEFSWEWTSHDGRYSKLVIAKVGSSGLVQISLFKDYFKGKDYGITVKPKFECAGVFLFAKTKPEYVQLSEIEVFSIKITPSFWPTFLLGSDVSVSCEASCLPEGATLQWEGDGEPTSNTTLFYNNTAHMVIYSVQQSRQRIYCCNVTLNAILLFTVCQVVKTEAVSSEASLTLYRQSSNNHTVTLLCVASNEYKIASWSWTSAVTARKVTVVKNAENGSNVMLNRFSSRDFNRFSCPLYISPLEFKDGGRFHCYFDDILTSSINVLTINVSTKPANGLLRNQSVVLRCEVSEVTGDPVTLAWLRMEGSRGVLVKQDVLTESHPNRMLNLTLPSLCMDQLHWQCVVFTQGMLRATASLTLTFPIQTKISLLTGTETMIRGGIVGAATLGMLGFLYFQCQRLKETHRQEEEPALQETTTV
ncbi:hypothetical protein UPYG_G00315560 [Umbra pygmaea]|uniref:Ig-like domain-containing protein n=1 Tax=Umbra pygmaea TaxID=75934 RepID=A0ABD0WJT5_UMBPY